MIKRGDTKLVPPNGVCEHCGTDVPGGLRHSYQRWSRVKVKVVGNLIRHFVCCRTCYVPSLPSQGGRTAISKDGTLQIYNKYMKLLPACRQVKVTRFCVGYKNEKVRFNPHSRKAAMDRYWTAVKTSKKRKRQPVELEAPVEFPKPRGFVRGKPLPLDVIITEEITTTLEPIDELGEPDDLQDFLADIGSSICEPDKGRKDEVYWEPYDPISSTQETRERKIFTAPSKTHGTGAFTITPLYAGQCIGSYAFDMMPITMKQLEEIPDNRRDYILPILGPEGEQLFLNGETSMDFAPRVNHSFESFNIRFDSAAQVHCTVDIPDASPDNPVELKANYGDAYWCHKLLRMEFAALPPEQQQEVSTWLRIVLIDDPSELSQRQLLCHTAWHKKQKYVVV